MAAGLDRLDDAFEEASDGLREGVRIRAEGIFEELHVGSQVRPGSVEAENSESPTPLHHDVIPSILGSLRRDDRGLRPDLARDRGAANFLAFRNVFLGISAYDPALDFDGGGSVDAADFLQFRNRYLAGSV